MIKLIIFSALISSEPPIWEGALLNEYDLKYDFYIEARKRNGKGNKKRKRGGNGLR